jgi:peroxiredoxin
MTMLPLRIFRDLLAGLLAIFGVLAISIYFQFVGSDLRVLFAVTGTAFYLAGLARGSSAPLNLWLKAVLVSSPGLIGTAALIINDGLHRIQIPIAVTLTSILLTALGVQTRRFWNSSRRKSLYTSTLSAAGLGCLVLMIVPYLAVHSSTKKTELPSPAFALAASDGRTVKSADLRSHVVVLAFWATWCLPCHWELPEVESVYVNFRDNSEVIFLAVDADWEGETPAKAQRFFTNRKFTLPWAFDSGGATRALGVDSLPTLILLDREGRVRLTHYGYDASEHLDKLISVEIKELLAARHN